MCSAWLQELAADIANFGSQKEQRTKAAQAKLKAAKSALEGAKKAVKDTAQKMAQAVAEAEAAATERTSLEEQLQAAQQALTGLFPLYKSNLSLHDHLDCDSTLHQAFSTFVQADYVLVCHLDDDSRM